MFLLLQAVLLRQRGGQQVLNNSNKKTPKKFKKGNFHGLGTFTFADGTIKKGMWVKGKLIIRLY